MSFAMKLIKKQKNAVIPYVAGVSEEAEGAFPNTTSSSTSNLKPDVILVQRSEDWTDLDFGETKQLLHNTGDSHIPASQV